MKRQKIRKCSNCDCEINKNDYYKCLDNFIQVKYFDKDEDNCFCSQECVCEYFSIENIYDEEAKQ